MNESADGESRGQRQEHEAGKPPVRRVRAHLTQDLETLTDDVREVVENFGQVAAAFALDGNGGDEELDVDESECARPAP